jgi:hypothetical protein
MGGKKQKSASFLKKRSKKLLLIWAVLLETPEYSKKNISSGPPPRSPARYHGKRGLIRWNQRA